MSTFRSMEHCWQELRTRPRTESRVRVRPRSRTSNGTAQPDSFSRNRPGDPCSIHLESSPLLSQKKNAQRDIQRHDERTSNGAALRKHPSRVQRAYKTSSNFEAKPDLGMASKLDLATPVRDAQSTQSSLGSLCPVSMELTSATKTRHQLHDDNTSASFSISRQVEYPASTELTPFQHKKKETRPYIH